MRPAPHLLRERLAPFAAVLPERPSRELRRAVLLEAACAIMAEFGARTVSLNAFARELGMCRSTAARLFPTLHHLLAALLEEHLTRIADCISLLPENTPNRPALVRAIYLRATRTEVNALLDVHLLLVRDRQFLPADLLAPIEELRAEIAAGFGPPGHRALAYALLDSPGATPTAIEALLKGGIAAVHAEADPAASKTPAAPAPRPHLRLAASAPSAPVAPDTTAPEPAQPPQTRRTATG